MCDFELALINSFNQRNPLCELLDVSSLFRNICGGRFKKNGRMDKIMEIFKDFEDNFIGRVHKNMRQQP
ncbi:hypothetical protein HZS_7521 [Henneguya salminicola]|nr:hypothetical protein HZS_7521 [Henneguya salminicola]